MAPAIAVVQPHIELDRFNRPWAIARRRDHLSAWRDRVRLRAPAISWWAAGDGQVRLARERADEHGALMPQSLAGGNA